MKPSERIAEALPAKREELMRMILDAASVRTDMPWDAEMRAEFEASKEGKETLQQIEIAAIQNVTLDYLDEEAERRSKFEADAMGRLRKLEAASTPKNQVGGFPPRVMCAQCGGPTMNHYRWQSGLTGALFCSRGCLHAALYPNEPYKPESE